ncbi:MAG TPA: phage portal protein [Rhodospirillaceae bacterium]|nr:MAG: phage portal protein [Alphaproteobacteria bacterium GWF2_58_20]HAU29811.1 phage portal protein [Rhodospirillaceae bacterium]
MGFIHRLFRSSTPGPSAPYEAAGIGRRMVRWMVGMVGPNNALSSTLDSLRNRARSLVRNNTYAAAAVERITANTIGTGIKPQSMVQDENLKNAIQQLWWDWVDEADADGLVDFYGMQALAMRSVVASGEVFIRMRPRFMSDGLSVPLQLQVLESEQCPVDKNEVLTSGNIIRCGIEFNAIGKRVAYWMWRYHPGDTTGTEKGPNELVRIPAEDIRHVYIPLRPGQLRGEPWLVRALIKLRDLDAYDDAELLRKKLAAMFVGFVYRPDPTGTRFGESDPDADGISEASLEPGTLQTLNPGEEIKITEPADVGGNYEAFMRQQARIIATSVGLLYEQLTGDYSQINDRTLRAALHEFRRSCQMWQHHLMVFGLCMPVWRRWLDMAVLSGAIKTKLRGRALWQVKWTPQAWPYLHPVQDVQAQAMSVRAGFKSRTEVVSETGYDANVVDREIAADNARADAMGLVYESDGRTTAPDWLVPASDQQPQDNQQKGGSNA